MARRDFYIERVIQTSLDPRTRSGEEIVRRVRLRELDNFLSALEALNLRDIDALPDRLSMRLRAAGVGHRSNANVTEVQDLVFRAQEAYLRPGHGTRRWTAA
jgi:hypothetical protein